MAGKPKPTALKIIEGDRGRRKPKDDVKPKPVAPDCPAELDRGAKAVWNFLAPKVERLGLMTEVDGDSFAGVCQTRSRLKLIWKELKGTNIDIASLNLNIKQSPRDELLINELKALKSDRVFWMKEERLYSTVFRMQAAEFGLSPRGRAGLSVGSAGDQDEGAELLT